MPLALTSSYINWSLLFSAAGLAEPELALNPSRSAKKCTMFVQTTLKQRKTAKSPLETRAVVSALVTRDEDILNGSEPPASSTLSEERRSVMSKVVLAMAPSCSMLNGYFGILR